MLFNVIQNVLNGKFKIVELIPRFITTSVHGIHVTGVIDSPPVISTTTEIIIPSARVVAFVKLRMAKCKILTKTGEFFKET